MNKKHTNCGEKEIIDFKKSIFIWLSWALRSIISIILIFMILFFIMKIIFEFTNFNFVEYFPGFFLISSFIFICIFLSMRTLKASLNRHYSVSFRDSSLVWLAWSWRFSLTTIIVLITELLFGFYRFSTNHKTRVPANHDQVTDYFELYIDILSIKATPGNLIILLTSIFFLKVGINKYCVDTHLSVDKIP